MEGARSRAKPPPSLSPGALDKRLDLRRRARADAAANLPRHDSDALSATELDILAAIAGERASLDSARQAAQTDSERRLRTLAPSPQDFSGPALEARLMLRQISGRLAHDWGEAGRRAAQARADLDGFKRANNLRRAAVYPESALLQGGLLLCAVLFEALFSAALFAEDLGYVSGAITAVGLSGANVTLGFLAGYLGLRYLQHARAPVKLAGAIALAALTLLAIMLNLFAADWRDALAAASGRPAETSADASFHLWDLLDLDTPQAIILLMLGAGVWAFAALKGYSGFDDPYPDYGKMQRSAEAAADAMSEVRNEGRESLEQPIEAAKAALNARLEKMRAEFEAMNRAFDEAAQRLGALDAQGHALDDAAAAAVQLYRQENTAARTSPAPAYFGAAPPTLGPALDPLSACAALIDEARARLAEAHQQSRQALETLLAELEAAAARLDQGGQP